MKTPHPLVRSRMDSPLGPLTLATHDQALVGIWFAQQAHAPDFAPWPEAPQHPLLQQAMVQLQQYFAGTRLHFELPLDLGTGTAFQQDVWQALRTIAHGRTVSYGAISQQIGKPRAVRAVGAAVGRNPFSIVVPCHRVLGQNGALTGYAGGLERKVALLQHENAAPPTRTPELQGFSPTHCH